MKVASAGTCLLAVLVTGLLAGLTPAPAAEPVAVVQWAAPTSGRTGQIGAAVEQVLIRSNVPLQTVREADLGTDPAAVVLYSGARLADAQLAALRQYVRGGGGVVYLFGTASRHAAPAGAFAGRFGLELELGRGPRDPLQLADHAMFTGVDTLPQGTQNARMSGPGLVPLVTQGPDVVAGAVEAGSGRVVLLPETLVSVSGRDPASLPQARLVANACLWAAGLDDALDEVRAGPLGDEIERITRDFLSRDRVRAIGDIEGAVVVDAVAADDDWQTIADVLDLWLSPVGIPVRYLDAERDWSPLVDAVERRPALLVLCSTRRFGADEAVAVSQYVRLGGRVLVISHASRRYVWRLVDMNTILREFDVAVAMRRPGGTTVLERHPITAGVGDLPDMPVGLTVWSLVADPIARVGNRPYVSALEVDRGRVAVMDGRLLMAGTRAFRLRGVTPETSPFRQLFDGVVAWLMDSGG